MKQRCKSIKGSVTLEAAILFPILIVSIVTIANIMIGACKTSIQVSSRISENTRKWSECAPGKSWIGVKDEIE